MKRIADNFIKYIFDWETYCDRLAKNALQNDLYRSSCGMYCLYVACVCEPLSQCVCVRVRVCVCHIEYVNILSS